MPISETREINLNLEISSLEPRGQYCSSQATDCVDCGEAEEGEAQNTPIRGQNDQTRPAPN